MKWIREFNLCSQVGELNGSLRRPAYRSAMVGAGLINILRGLGNVTNVAALLTPVSMCIR